MVVLLTIKDNDSLISIIEYLTHLKIYSEQELAAMLQIPKKTLNEIKCGLLEPTLSIATTLVQLFYNLALPANQYLFDEFSDD